jgi:ABC-type glycerol-3-phosphate transport system substrate-binding protein
MNKKFIVGVFSLFFVLTLFGCGGGNSGDKSDVVIWHWMTDREGAFEELAKRYEEETGVKVSFELYAPSDAYSQKVRASAQTGTLPDVYGLLAEKRDFAAFIKAGHITDLTEYMDGLAHDKTARMAAFIKKGHVKDLTVDMGEEPKGWRTFFFLKALAVNIFPPRNQWEVQPGIYGVPIDVTNIQMLYNKDLFKKAGLDPERPPQTWEEFLETGRALKAAGIPGLISGWGEIWMIDCFASNYAMNIMGKDKVVATIKGEVSYTDPDWIKVFSIFKQMADEGLLGSGIVAMVNKTAEQTFANGRAAFAFNGSWCVNVYKGMNPNLNYAAMLPPKINPDNPMYIWGGAGASFLVNNRSKSKVGAIEFLKWLTAEKQQAFLSKETSNLPANRRSLVDIPPILAQFADDMENTTHPNILPVNEYSQVLEFFTKGIQSIIIGEKTPEEVAQKVQEVKERRMEWTKKREAQRKARMR